jgi:hypothetical protein
MRTEEEMKCNFCSKDQDNVSYLIVGKNSNICDECILLRVNIIFEKKMEKNDNIQWVEASSIDPRDKKVYFARVNKGDYNSLLEAYSKAKARSNYLALRGYEKDCLTQ